MAAGLVVVGLIVATVLLLLWLWQSSSVRQTLDKIPGPKSLPLIGNAHLLKHDGHEFFEQLLSFCDTYGSSGGICRLWMGPFTAVLLSKAHTIEPLLNSSTHITKSRDYDFLHPWLATGLLTSTGDKWKVRRRLLTPTFHFKILADFLQVFNEQARILVDKLGQKTGDKTPFDIFPYITLCALDIICDSAMGKNVGAQSARDSEYVRAVHKIGEVIQARMKTPWWRPDIIFNNTKSGRIHQKCLGILHGFTRKVIRERSEELDEQLASRTGKVTMEDLQTDKPFLIGKQKRLAFLDMLLVAAKGGADLSHADIQEEVDTFMFEGHDTTAAASTWAIYLLGRHPKIQKRAQQELDEMFGGEDRDITMEDIKNMKYLDCVIKEALRIYPSVPSIARHLEQDCQINGYTVPKGSSAIIMVAALHKDPKHFPDPERFDPDRWLPENAAGRHPYCYVPFSAGFRNCIGQKFAVNEEKVIIASILRNFTITSHEDPADVKRVGELIMRPEGGILVTLASRT